MAKKEKPKLPRFVRLSSTGTAFILGGNKYHRHAGLWDLDYRIINGVLLSWCPMTKYKKMPWLHRKPLIEITQDEWKQDNKGYVDENADYSVAYKGYIKSDEDELSF